MRLWLKELLEDPVSLATLYTGVILLVVLWAMALLSRRLRATQARLEALTADVQVLNEALKTVTGALQDQAHVPRMPSVPPPAPGGLSDEELAAMPPIR